MRSHTSLQQAGRTEGRPLRVGFVWFIWSILFVSLLDQQKPNKPNNRDRPNNGLLRLAGFFSVPLALLGRMSNKRRIELLHLVAAAFRAFHFAGFMILER